MSPARVAEARPPDPEALKALLSALLAYEAAPGRFALVLREPRKVFEHLRLVLQLAAGRPIDTPWQPDEEAKARQAARFFVRTAMLRPGADHYTLLGLAPGFEPEAIKDHFRMMIRLTHPDFASPEDAWPADAAARINIANTVLASPTEREAYTAQLLKDRERQTSLAAPPAVVQTPKPAKARSPRTMGLSEAWAAPKWKAWAFGLGVLACLTGLMLANPAVEDRTLKARSPAAIAEDTRPALKVTEFIGESRAHPAGMPVAAETGQPEKPNKADQALAMAAPAKAVMAANAAKPVGASLADSPKTAPKASAPVAPLSSVAPVLPTAVPLPATPPPRLKPSTELAMDAQKKTTDTTAPLKTAARAPTPAIKAQPLPPSAAALASAKPGPPPVVAEVPAQQLAMAAPPASTPEAGSNISAEDVRSVMQGLAKVLESGRGRNAYSYLAPESRATESTLQFVRAYQDALKGQKVLQINRSNWVSVDHGDGLLVKGTYELVLEDYPGSSYVKNLTLQAQFVERHGKTVLTRITLLQAAEGTR